MRLSQTFVKTLKQISSEEKSINARLLIRGGFISQLMAGVYTYLPMGWRVFKKIEDIIRQEMNNIGGEEIFMPSLTPKEIWETTGRWETLDVLFRFTTYYTKKEVALGSTHEEVIVPLMKDYIFSYKDLPKYVYQIQNKFRDELRAKSGILRAKEFFMKDLYSFHKDEKDLDDYYQQVKKAYERIFERVGIGDKTYFTYASGGTFSKYSHEFQAITDAGEDLIHICNNCKVAINTEIIQDLENKCPECGNENLLQAKAIEVGNIFKLGTKYSMPFDLSYVDENNNKKPVIMGCYGIGLGRLLGTIVEMHHDEKGIVWPLSVAPYKYVIIGIGEVGSSKADDIYKLLNEKGVEVAIDDRDESVGFKFKDADLVGYPYQIVVSEKTLSNGPYMIELINRKTGQKQIVDYRDLD